MFIEKNMLGRTQPSHLRDLGTGRLQSSPARWVQPFPLHKVLGTKMNSKLCHERDFWKEIIEKMVLLFQSSHLVVRRRKVREKSFWTLANFPTTFQKPLCPNGRARRHQMLWNISGEEGQSLSRNLGARRQWKNGRDSEVHESHICVLIHWTPNNMIPDCSLGDGTSRHTLDRQLEEETYWLHI